MAESNEPNVAVPEGERATRPITEPELKALSKDLQEVLVKHNAEMGVTSTINLMKVIEINNDSKTPAEESGKEEEKTDTEAEEGS